MTGVPFFVYDVAKTNKTYTKNLTGISYDDLIEYAGDRLVTALRVDDALRFDHDVEFNAKPPQNWGTFRAVRRHDKEA